MQSNLKLGCRRGHGDIDLDITNFAAPKSFSQFRGRFDAIIEEPILPEEFVLWRNYYVYEIVHHLFHFPVGLRDRDWPALSTEERLCATDYQPPKQRCYQQSA